MFDVLQEGAAHATASEFKRVFNAVQGYTAKLYDERHSADMSAESTAHVPCVDQSNVCCLTGLVMSKTHDTLKCSELRNATQAANCVSSELSSGWLQCLVSKTRLLAM